MTFRMLTVIAAMLIVGATAYGQERDDLDAGAKMPVAEAHVTAVLAPTNPRRLFVLDTAFPAAEAAKTYIVDGETGKLEGMFSQGYWPNFAISPDGSTVYAADTYFEKHTRGRRQDFVVVRDARTLAVLDDILLPNGRFLIVTKKFNFGVTPDGHYALSYNLAPRTSVSVVDLVLRKYVGEIDIPGCGLIFPQSPDQFTTLCADGSVETVTFDAQLKASIERVRKVFDAEKDPVFEHSGWDKQHQMLYLVSYSGSVVPLALSGATPIKQASWSLTTAAERQAGWKPGGWQVTHFHVPSRRLYVLMHRGHEWTHKDSGTEVWVYDVQTQKLLQKINLSNPAQSIAVSQDESPLLYTIIDGSEVITYNSATGKVRGKMENLGFSPQILTVPGE
jgi:methylamine dehydrogenase heavy chain